ncbi:hypothetical protein [Actinoplanes sp. URMC 104]|uniref:hypothetical protein n=1 Tax=Actinoplanes sp. URMC 104 TaxID=3423409 RepID=UPI003F1B9C37
MNRMSRATALTFVPLALGAIAVAPAGPAQAVEGHPAVGCREAHAQQDLRTMSGQRMGTVHLRQYWCWDGAKVTQVSDPRVTITRRILAQYTYKWTDQNVTKIDREPQNGGYWTRQTVLTGVMSFCVLKYGCIRSLDIELDQSLFGDGVSYVAP